MNFARTNLIDRLNRKSPLAAQVGLGDLLEEIIVAINNHANRVFTVFPAWKDWQGTFNAVSTNFCSVTTTHLDVLNSMVHTINTVTEFLASSDFLGSAQFKAVATTATVTSSTAKPLASNACSAAAITISTDIHDATGDTITSYNSVMTAANSATLAQIDVLDALTDKVAAIQSFFSVASCNNSATEKLSVTWNRAVGAASNVVSYSQTYMPAVTANSSKTVAEATIMTDLCDAQALYNNAMRRLYYAGHHDFFGAIHDVWSVTTAVQDFLTNVADYTGKQTEALAAMEIPGSVTISLDDVMLPADLYSVASASSALADITPVTEIVTLETRGETGGFS